MIVPKHYENLKIMHENTMPERAYYIPASRRMDNLVEHREYSDRMQLLNGQWKFRYYNSIYDLQEHFYEEDASVAEYQSIPVPGVWQNYGYDSHQYTNVRYPIPLDPPYVPLENPCGTYVHEFEYQEKKEAPRAFLNFEGVDSCFYVWLNGHYVGYSQVSHSNSEFDVTDVIRDGKNRLAVLVLKWCDGSYLEDQDKFRYSGIFRDVYLLKRPEYRVADYFTTTKIHGKFARVEVLAELAGTGELVNVMLYDAENNLVDLGMLEAISPEESGHLSDCVEDRKRYTYRISMNIASPVLWNPECPYLYTLVLQTKEEVITDRIGIREIEVRGNVIYFNGKPIKFNGVNRHDSDPVTGPVIGMEQMKQDLLMMKQYNFNAIRSSHYPNVPMFYQLCDQYGFYVIDEADNESHGTQSQYLADASWENQVEHWNKRIANNPDFIEPVMDRIRLCVHRDKNRPCIVIWSAGNECAYGCTFEESLKWIKQFDPTRLTCYESSFYRSSDRKYDYSNIDIYSRMYPSFDEIKEYLEKKPDKPYLLIEYCHAMGNGPGDLEDYLTWIRNYDVMCGGFVWEWCDHAVYKGIAENGKAMYHYGGDHNERIHDGNFCMDGLVYPDRTPHTGLLEYKNIYRPARVVSYDQESGTVILHNHMDFKDLKDYVNIGWELNCDGVMISSGNVEIGESIPPHKDGSVSIKAEVPVVGKCYLKVVYYLKKSDELRSVNHELGFDEIPLSNKDSRNQTTIELLTGVKAGRGHRRADIRKLSPVSVEESDRYYVICGQDFRYVFHRLTGLFQEMQMNGEELFTRPMEVNIWRAPTDNDRKLKLKWYNAHYDHSCTKTYQTSCHYEGNDLVICAQMAQVADTVQPIMKMDAVWMISPKGEIRLNMSVKRDMEFPELPRFGLRFFLNETFDQAVYYGLGPDENYRDKCHAASHGLFTAKVENLHEDYIRPQENGSRGDCDYVIMESNTHTFAAVSAKTFSFQASVYTQEELTEKRHNYELVPSGSTVFCVDYEQNGIGSNSCGPELTEKYRFDEEEFCFGLKLIPTVKTEA